MADHCIVEMVVGILNDIVQGDSDANPPAEALDPDAPDLLPLSHFIQRWLHQNKPLAGRLGRSLFGKVAIDLDFCAF